MERGNLFADIIPDRRSGPDIYYVIVQERGSSEVLSLDRHESLQAAENSAEYVLRALAEKAA
jgi:hypothetical protein